MLNAINQKLVNEIADMLQREENANWFDKGYEYDEVIFITAKVEADKVVFTRHVESPRAATRSTVIKTVLL